MNIHWPGECPCCKAVRQLYECCGKRVCWPCKCGFEAGLDEWYLMMEQEANQEARCYERT